MAHDYSFRALVDFLDYASDMGLLKANTAGGLKTAASKVSDDLTEQESDDVRVIDLDQLFQRFVNRNKVEVAPSTLRVYKRRLGTAIEEFISWRSDPTGYKPGIGSRRGGRGKKDEPKAGTRTAAASVSIAEPLDRGSAEPATKVLTLPFPLRPDFLVTIQIPRDLKAAEADRLAAFVKTLATDEPAG